MVQQNTHWYWDREFTGFTADPNQAYFKELLTKGFHNCKLLGCSEIHYGSAQHYLTTTRDFKWVHRIMFKGIVPMRWKLILCHCSNPTYTFDLATSKPICANPNCGRFHTFSLHRCVSCDKYFLFDFWHPAFDLCATQCWDCIKDVPATEVCKNYTEGMIERNIEYGVVPPMFKHIYEHLDVPVDSSLDSLLAIEFPNMDF